MFLRPQHFQAADRHWNEVARTGEQWDHQYGYGLRSIKISTEAISNSQFEVQSIHARMRDGTLVSVESEELNRINLKAAFASKDVVRLFLAVPRVNSTGANVGDPRSGSSRYFAVPEDVPEEAAGGNDQQIEFRKLRVVLLDSTEERPGYELLPIAQLRRAFGGEAVPQLDQDYVPPVIAVDAWTQLERDYVRPIFDMIGTKIDMVAQQVRNRGITLASQEPGDLERILMLRILNEAAAVLRVLTFARGVHPFVAYTELCRAIGMLSIFDSSRQLAEVEEYDHDDLGRIFKWAKERIKRLINQVQEDQYEHRKFVGTTANGSPQMHVDIDPNWLTADWDLFIGTRAENATRKVAQFLFSREGQLDRKFGSAERVHRLFSQRRDEVRFDLAEQVPRALPLTNDWLYYEIDQNCPEWKKVCESRRLAVQFSERSIDDLQSLNGSTVLPVKARGRRVDMEISIFAVRRAGAAK